MPEGQSVVASTYTIIEEIVGSYLANGATRRLALLVPVTDARPPLDRGTGDVILSYRPNVLFDLHGSPFTSNAAIIECANESLSDTFRVLSDDIARAVRADRARPTPHAVSRALARWEELLRAQRSLSREEEVGLWGELWMLLQCPDPDRGVAVWRGPQAEFVDFVGGGVGIECKTSFQRLQHFISQEQLTRPLGDLDVFFLSLWIDQDAIEGKTVNDLISDIDARLTDHSEFEEKLLGTGYSRSDAQRYRLKLRLLERPLLIPSSVIPRVRSADAGVSHIRFLATLAEETALAPDAGLALTMKLCSA
jgi:hypothetical protein